MPNAFPGEELREGMRRRIGIFGGSKKAVGKSDVVVGLNAFNFKRKSLGETLNKVQGFMDAFVAISPLESVARAIVNGVKDVRFLVLDGKRDIFDIELNALTWTI